MHAIGFRERGSGGGPIATRSSDLPGRIGVRAAPFGALIASFLVALVAGGCASPRTGGSSAPSSPELSAPTAGSSASAGASSASPGPETFVSGRYGYSIELPTGASPRPAIVDWDAGCLCGLANPAWDVASVDGRTFAIGAAKVDGTMDLARWQAKMRQLAPAICTDSDPPTVDALGGAKALAWTGTCADGNAIKLALLHAG